jgi:hypothetical protein
MGWLLRLDGTLAPIPAYNVADSIKRQADSNLEFRAQLLMNETKVVQTILKGYGCESVDLAILATRPAYNATVKGLLLLNGNAAVKLTSASNAIRLMTCKKDPTQTDKVRVVALALTDAIQKSTASPTQPDPEALIDENSRRYAEDLLMRLIFDEQKDAGYTIADLTRAGSAARSAGHALIIGVVGKETIQEVSSASFQVSPDWTDDQVKAEKGEKPANDKTGARSYQIVTGDPRLAVTAVLRAAWKAKENHEADFDRVIVLAQMPPTEAEELTAHVQEDLDHNYLPGHKPVIDLVIAEAQEGHESRSLKTCYRTNEYTPVMAPPDASKRVWTGANPISTVTIATEQTPGSRELDNTWTPPTSGRTSPDAAILLKAELLKN